MRQVPERRPVNRAQAYHLLVGVVGAAMALLAVGWLRSGAVLSGVAGLVGGTGMALISGYVLLGGGRTPQVSRPAFLAQAVATAAILGGGVLMVL